MLHKRTERGQAIILIVFSIIGLIGLTALTVDSGVAYSDRRSAQGAADSAALAAALAYVRGRDFVGAAQSIASSNGYTGAVTKVSYAESPSDTCLDSKGVHIPGSVDITVEIISTVDTFFGPVIGIETVTNKVSASTRVCSVTKVTTGGTGKPLYDGNSVVATKTGNCGGGLKDSTIYSNGSSQVQLWGGGLGSASTDPNCMYLKGGNIQMKKAESGTACANINMAAASGGTFNAVSPQDGCGKKVYGQTFDPPPGDLGITCSGDAKVSGSSMSAGNWTGAFPPKGVSTLQAGTYCVNGDFDVNANQKLTGTGVTIVMNSGSLRWNGNSEVKLSAPTEGDLKGLVIYAPPSNAAGDIDVNGSSNASITGTVLAENSDCFFAGSGQLQKQKLQFICSTWGINGNGDAQLVYDSNSFFAPPPIVTLVDPTISLTK